MSSKLKHQLAYGIFFVAGIIILGIQIKKYYFDTLELSIEEIIVTLVAISLILNPRFLLEGIQKIINLKLNGKNTDGK